MSYKTWATNIFKLLEKQNGCCEYCWYKFTNDKLPTSDHKIPRTDKNTSNNISNIVLACDSCNIAKWAISYEDFKKILQWFNK